MNKITKLVLLFLTLTSLMPSKAKATQCAGAELEYEWVSGSTYRLYLKFYRDCTSTAPAPSNVQVCYYNSCSTTQYSVVLQPITGLLPPPNPLGLNNGADISFECAASNYRSTCNGGSLPGYQVWCYTAVVTLPVKCNYWTFEWSANGRNPAITNLLNPGSNGIYVSATLDNLDAEGDTSPNFSILPVPYICINQPYTYNNGAYDTNGDTLHFDMINPLQGGCGTSTNPSAVPYVSPANTPGDSANYNLLNNPLICQYTFQFNNNTGAMYFIPTALQTAVVAIRLSEYRRINGVVKKIGTVERDIQIVVIACSNVPPSFSIDPLTLTGGTVDSSSGTIYGCSLNPLNFCCTAATNNPASLLVITDNHSQVFSNATVTYSGPSDSVKGCFSWTPAATDTGTRILAVLIKDSSCTPSSGGYVVDQVYTIPIIILPQTSVLGDTTICQGDTTYLEAVGGGNFTWDVLPGGSPLSTLSCTNCTSPIATPNVTTRYTVTANSSLYCKNTDTVTITVIPAIKVSSVDTTTCANNSLQLNLDIVAPPPGNQYTVSWSPATFLSNPNIANPVITTNDTANMRYIITITPTGYGHCTVYDTMNVKVKPAAVISLPDSVIVNPDDSVQLIPSTNCIYFTWSPGLGLNDTNVSDPIASPGVSTKYTVNGTTNFGCAATTSIYVFVPPDSYIIIPNAFAPGTGPNNQLKVLSLHDAVLNSFHIYNRWGIEVFQTTDVSKGWDGTYGGELQSMGVYIYIVEATTFQGKKVTKQGNITLLR